MARIIAEGNSKLNRLYNAIKVQKRNAKRFIVTQCKMLIIIFNCFFAQIGMIRTVNTNDRGIL